MNKIVRDKILHKMRDDGFQLNLEYLPHRDYIKALQDKLIEESHEVYHANNKTELIDELADVFEVIKTMLQLHNIEFEQLLEHCNHKRNIRGDLGSRYKVNSIYLDENNPDHTKWIDYFSANPEKYPVTKELANESV